MPRLLLVTMLLVILLSACAPAAPTVDPAQIQASAMAAASTMIALTQAAIPTATPPPPTPPPSPTLLTLPTLGLLPTLQGAATPTTAAAAGNCNAIFDVGASGPKAPVLIKNTTKAPITVGLKMNTKNTFGQCGYIVWSNIPKAGSVTGSVPLVHTNLGDSCYYGYAIVNDPKHPSNPGGGPWCIDNQLKWTITVGLDSIKLTPP